MKKKLIGRVTAIAIIGAVLGGLTACASEGESESLTFDFKNFYTHTYAGGLVNHRADIGFINGDGSGVDTSEVISVKVLDTNGATIIPSNTYTWVGDRIAMTWDDSQGALGSPEIIPTYFERLVYSQIDFVAGDYTIEAELDDGNTLTGRVAFPGSSTLAEVSNMTAVWNAGALELSWNEPVSNHNTVVVALWDSTNFFSTNKFIWVRLPVGRGSVTIPASVVSQLPVTGPDMQWNLHLRTYDASGDVVARSTTSQSISR